MAILAATSPLYGAQGLVGGLLFRTIDGRTVVSSYEARSQKKESALQRRTRSRFAEASKYAKVVLRDPVKREYYRKKAKQLRLTSAYTAAITDFMRQGKIEHVDTSKLARKGQLTIKANKRGLDLTEITVRLITKDGKEVARGKATPRTHGTWAYRHTTPLFITGGTRIVVEAKDTVGNTVTAVREAG